MPWPASVRCFGLQDHEDEVVKMLSVRLDAAEAVARKALYDRIGMTQSELSKRSIAELTRCRLARQPPATLARELGLVRPFERPSDVASRSRRYLGRALRQRTAR